MELHELIKQISKMNNKDIELRIVPELYLDFVKSNRRPGTYKHDEHHLRIVCDYLRLKQVLYTKDIDIQLMYKFIREQKESNIGNRTINKRVSVLKWALNLAIETEYISTNPIDKLKKLKETDRIIETIPINIIKKNIQLRRF